MDYFAEESYSWHVRLLVANCGVGVWIWATPDLEVQYSDLSSHTYPARVDGDLYAFDPLSDDELNTLWAEAVALGQVLGVEVQKRGGSGSGPGLVLAGTAPSARCLTRFCWATRRASSRGDRARRVETQRLLVLQARTACA